MFLTTRWGLTYTVLGFDFTNKTQYRFKPYFSGKYPSSKQTKNQGKPLTAPWNLACPEARSTCLCTWWSGPITEQWLSVSWANRRPWPDIAPNRIARIRAESFPLLQQPQARDWSFVNRFLFANSESLFRSKIETKKQWVLVKIQFSSNIGGSKWRPSN